MLNRVKNTELSRATTLVCTQEYPIQLPVVEICQMLRRNARCLPRVHQECQVKFVALYLNFLHFIHIYEFESTRIFMIILYLINIMSVRRFRIVRTQTVIRRVRSQVRHVFITPLTLPSIYSSVRLSVFMIIHTTPDMYTSTWF